MRQNQDVEQQLVLAVREFAHSIQGKTGAASSVARLTAVTDQLPLSNLDYWERLIRSEYSAIVDQTPISKWQAFRKSERHLTFLDLFSWDGYKREKTFRTLSGAALNGFFFSLALRRLNDWVPEVRVAACEQLPQIAATSDPDQVVNAVIATLAHWGSWSRAGESEKKILLGIATSGKTIIHFKEKIITASAGPITTLLGQIGRDPAIDCFLPEIASSAVQPSVRAKAYRSLMEGKMKWLDGRKWEWTDLRYCQGKMVPIISERPLTELACFEDTISAAAVDTSSMVRRVAAELLIAKLSSLGSNALPLAEIFATDHSSSVSERGRYALRKLNESI